MKTYTYVWFFLFVLAIAGMVMALHKDTQRSTSPSDYRWIKLALLMFVLAAADATMLISAD